MRNKITILGTRGSLPVSGTDYTIYGQATTCYLAEMDGDVLFIDAGTGLLNRKDDNSKELSLLLTHCHIDHLLGLPLFPFLFQKGNTLHIYSAHNAEKSISALFQKPLWPISLSELPADIQYHPLKEKNTISGISVETLPGIHPDGVTLLKLIKNECSVVILTDCTLHETMSSKAVSFAKNCDLLLCDGQYSEEEWKTHQNFGHSTWNMAARVFQEAHAKQMRIIHHDPSHQDQMLKEAEKQLQKQVPGCFFAKENEEIYL